MPLVTLVIMMLGQRPTRSTLGRTLLGCDGMGGRIIVFLLHDLLVIIVGSASRLCVDVRDRNGMGMCVITWPLLMNTSPQKGRVRGGGTATISASSCFAFGDLGTLVLFVAAYIAILKMDAAAILLGMGVALIMVGALYRTLFPVQSMKASRAVAVGQAAAGMTAAAVVGAGLVTGIIWVTLA